MDLDIITPTVGRKVWYRPGPSDTSDLFGGNAMAAHQQPLDGTVVYVHGNRLINLSVFDANGRHFARTSVALLQPGDEPPVGQAYAEWMPYQKGQALKHQEPVSPPVGGGAEQSQTGTVNSGTETIAGGEVSGDTANLNAGSVESTDTGAKTDAAGDQAEGAHSEERQPESATESA